MAAPFKCSLSKCEENVSSSTLLSHFLIVHQHEENGFDLKDIEEKEKTTLKFSVTDEYLELDKNLCLGVLMFNAVEVNHSNELLPKPYEYLDRHIPILIMACRCNYLKIFDNEDESIDPDADFLVIWLAMPETICNKKLLSTITVHNKNFSKSMSSMTQVRSANNTQDACQFMQTESDFLIVNAEFLKKICSNGNVFLEVSVAEDLS